MATKAHSGATDEWADLPDNQRTDMMVAEYTRIAALNTEAQRAKLAEYARSAYGLPEAELCAITESRIRAWFGMDPDSAARVAHDGADASMAVRRVAVVRSVAAQLTIRRVGSPRSPPALMSSTGIFSA